MSTTELSDLVLLGRARQWLRDRIDEGVRCPCCTQTAKVYNRPLNRTAARLLVELYRHRGQEWTHIPSFAANHLPDVAHQGGYLTLAQHWSLIEEERSVRADGGRVGWWRLTSAGEQFVRGQLRVPQKARLYGGRLLNLAGPLIGVREALGAGFDLRDIR